MQTKQSAFRKTAQRPWILHISDTLTRTYPSVRAMVEALRPELVIHTGDMADECKVGRRPEDLPAYQTHVRSLMEGLCAHAGEVWVVPGNNDDPEFLRSLPGIRVITPGSRVEVFGVRLALSHFQFEWIDGVDFALYGHGPTQDIHDPADNLPGGVQYLNGINQATLIEARTKAYCALPYCFGDSKPRRILLARHGQVLPNEYVGGDVNLPRADPPLSRLGEMQAQWLGERLRLEGFHGEIHSSPFTRTLQTAQAVAAETGSPIKVAPLFREIVKTGGDLTGFQGKTLAEMRARFPSIVSDTLAYPWWKECAESYEAVQRRVAPLVRMLLGLGEPCLLVGHGASVSAAVGQLLRLAGYRPSDICRKEMYNASLSAFDWDGETLTPTLLYDHAHIPLTLISANAKMGLERAEDLEHSKDAAAERKEAAQA